MESTRRLPPSFLLLSVLKRPFQGIISKRIQMFYSRDWNTWWKVWLIMWTEWMNRWQQQADVDASIPPKAEWEESNIENLHTEHWYVRRRCVYEREQVCTHSWPFEQRLLHQVRVWILCSLRSSRRKVSKDVIDECIENGRAGICERNRCNV